MLALTVLVASATSRKENRRALVSASQRKEVVTHLLVDQAHPLTLSEPWSAYWRPCRGFLEADRCLVHRLVELKKAWLAVLRKPRSEVCQRVFCWRYFGLLHHTLRIARAEPHRGDPIPVLRGILAFETFPIEVRGREGTAAGTLSSRNPVYLLGRLRDDAPLPTPRHVPLVLPLGQPGPFYCYRQLRLSENGETSLLMFPAVELFDRAQSFAPIDRVTRLMSAAPDPYSRPRARLLVRRVLRDLLRAQLRSDGARRRLPMRLLDLGAGTGHFAANVWHALCRTDPRSRPLTAAFHFVDSVAPSYGRSFGISREVDTVRCVEWTTANYRELLDDDFWLKANGPFDWVLICRLLGNASNVLIEDAVELSRTREADWASCNPADCLAPRRRPSGLDKLETRTIRRVFRGGVTMPQLSLSDYFAAMRAATAGSLDAITEDGRYLPVRRFNPASLTTARGRSVLAQLLKAASSIIIEDLDLRPQNLVTHRRQFGLDGTAAVHCRQDGFSTEAQHYVITGPDVADRLVGERLW